MWQIALQLISFKKTLKLIFITILMGKTFGITWLSHGAAVKVSAGAAVNGSLGGFA